MDIDLIKSFSTESRKRIVLSEKDKADILELNKTITTVPRDIVEASYDDVLSTLENGNSLNRLVRIKDEKGEDKVIAYIGCVDRMTYSNQKELYVKYACSNNPQFIFSGRQEIIKFLDRAKKLGYSYIRFDGFNDKLNKILEHFGFKTEDNPESLPKSYKLDLSSYDSAEWQERNIEYLPWRRYRENNSQAEEVWVKLTFNQKKHINKLLQDNHKTGNDPELHSLYGAINTLVGANEDVIKITTLQAFYKKAREINNQNTKQENARTLSKALLKYLNLENLNLENELREFLKTFSKDKYHSGIVELLQKYEISYDPEIVFNSNFLFSLERENSLEIMGILDSRKFPYQVCKLFSKSEMVKETNALGHCVGNSDFYIEKVKLGKILVISLRDQGITKWTIEYNIKDKNIIQFKGGGDVSVNSLPESEELVLATLNFLSKHGCPVEKMDENFDYSVVYDKQDFLYQKIDNSELREKINQQTNGINIIKGKILIDETFSEEEVLKLTKVPGLILDLTQAKKEIKSNIVNVSGGLIDSSMQIYYPNLQTIGGYADFSNLTSAEGLSSLQTIGGYADFSNLTSAEGLSSLQTIGGYANFSNLTSAEGLSSLQTIGGGYANFSNLTSAEGLSSLQTIGGSANFSNLTSAEGLSSLQTIGGGYANFSNLTSAEGLSSLQTIGGSANFSNLTSAEGLSSLQTIGGSAYFPKLIKDDLDKLFKQINK